MKMVVVGLGYLGLTHAVAMAELGHTVVGLETDVNKLQVLSEGRVPFYEPHLDDALDVALSSGRLTFASGYDDFSADADIHWICVGTPQMEGSRSANIGYVEAAALNAAKVLKNGATIVGKSTVPVGTSVRLRNIIDMNVQSGVVGRLAWNPEFLREGTALQDSLKPDRIVVGVDDDVSRELLGEAYRSILDEGTPFIITDLPTSELVKVSANSFLAMKISFINAIAEVSEKTGADVVKLAEAIGYDDRIGRKFLRSGIGFGGGCLPKDIRGFMAKAEELEVDSLVGLLTNVDEINLGRRQKAVELALSQLGDDILLKKVAVLGATFKPDSDDIRDSPALAVALELHNRGAHVVIHDPKGLKNVNVKYPQLHTNVSINETLLDADLVMLLTEWSDYVNFNPLDASVLVRTSTIIDGRNALDARLWKTSGWNVLALGRSL